MQAHLRHRLRPALFCAVLSMLAACGGGGAPGDMQMPPAAVGVAEVVAREFTERREFPGRFEAVSRVEVRPRVAGYLVGMHFEEGAMVEAGDLLFSIDAREYEAALAAAQADVARAESRLAVAETELARNRRLIERNAVSQGRLDTALGEQQQAAADLALMRARADDAALRLEFTRVTAPIRGRVSEALVRPGNLVTPGETLLTTVVSVDPVHVRFEPDEETYLRLQALAQARDASGAAADTATHGADVEIGLATDAGFPYRGRLEFLDNALDPGTGTIRARALLDNPDGRFTPGLFARVRVPVGAPSDVLLVNEQAILTDQDRKYVFVVDEGNVAGRRDVRLGPQVDGLRVIREGLAPGDRVVVTGTRRIFFPGAPLDPSLRSMEAPAEPLAAAELP